MIDDDGSPTWFDVQWFQSNESAGDAGLGGGGSSTDVQWFQSNESEPSSDDAGVYSGPVK